MALLVATAILILALKPVQKLILRALAICCLMGALSASHQLPLVVWWQKHLLVYQQVQDLQMHQGVAIQHLEVWISTDSLDPPPLECQKGQRIPGELQQKHFSPPFDFKLFYASRLCSTQLL